MKAAGTTTVVSVLSPPLAAPTLVAQAPPTSVAAMSELAALVRPLGSAEYDAAEHAAAPRPVAVTIEALAVIEAPVVPVGVTASGELDVPRPDIVGWYEFGPSPRETGTTVLAAHVNFNGIDGVFRNLRKLEAGSFIDVRLADRSTQRYLATDVGLFDKDEL